MPIVRQHYFHNLLDIITIDGKGLISQMASEMAAGILQ